MSNEDVMKQKKNFSVFNECRERNVFGFADWEKGNGAFYFLNKFFNDDGCVATTCITCLVLKINVAVLMGFTSDDDSSLGL